MPIFFRPGQQLKLYQIYRKEAVTDEKGRVTYIPVNTAKEPLETVLGSISLTSPKEAEQWKQLGHTVTHTIVVRGRTAAEPEDILIQGNGKYYIEGKRDNGGLGVFTALYCKKAEGDA